MYKQHHRKKIIPPVCDYLRAAGYIYGCESFELLYCPSALPVKLFIDQCKLPLFRHEKLGRRSWMPVSGYANDIEKECQA